MECEFREIQRFNFKIVWVLIFLISAIMVYAFLDQLTGSFHKNPAPDFLIFIITPVIGIGFPVFFYFLRMETIVSSAEIKISYFPLSTAKFKISDIDKIIAREYNPLNEFGGWGIRGGYKIKCYTMSGKEGVEIKLKSGYRVLIGTHYKDDLYRAISKQIPNSKIRFPNS